MRGYTQCHFFAGIGVWSYALRRAGWSDDRPVWTGSCPCQPFSAAGKGAGFDDERHIWPSWFHLISECRPAVVFGEQVASSAVEPWIDLVQADVESLGHAFGCVPFPSAGVNAPHIRDRAYWLAYADSSARREGRSDVRGRLDRGDAQPRPGSGGGGLPGGMGYAQCLGAGRHTGASARAQGGSELRSVGDHARSSGAARGLADTEFGNAAEPEGQWNRPGNPQGARAPSESQGCSALPASRPTGPADSFWRDVDWLFCRDGKWRPVEPGTFPLVDGAPSRVGRLRAYGNAINAEAARAFIEASRDALLDIELL
nr:DNA cytosine methyltransferase [Burkholderia gladioli]